LFWHFDISSILVNKGQFPDIIRKLVWGNSSYLKYFSYYSILKPAPTDTSELGKVWELKEVERAVRVGTGPLNLF